MHNPEGIGSIDCSKIVIYERFWDEAFGFVLFL